MQLGKQELGRIILVVVTVILLFILIKAVIDAFATYIALGLAILGLICMLRVFHKKAGE